MGMLLVEALSWAKHRPVMFCRPLPAPATAASVRKLRRERTEGDEDVFMAETESCVCFGVEIEDTNRKANCQAPGGRGVLSFNEGEEDVPSTGPAWSRTVSLQTDNCRLGKPQLRIELVPLSWDHHPRVSASSPPSVL